MSSIIKYIGLLVSLDLLQIRSKTCNLNELLKKYVFESIKAEILSWNNDFIKNIYVISLYISNSEDEDFYKALKLGDEITSRFVELYVEVVKKLHEEEEI